VIRAIALGDEGKGTRSWVGFTWMACRVAGVDQGDPTECWGGP
jgi:hypothetical protein